MTANDPTIVKVLIKICVRSKWNKACADESTEQTLEPYSEHSQCLIRHYHSDSSLRHETAVNANTREKYMLTLSKHLPTDTQPATKDKAVTSQYWKLACA